MKFIQYANLTYLNTLLEGHLGDCVLRGTVEAYSCKPVKRDRKLSHIIERRLQEESDDGIFLPNAVFAAPTPATDAFSDFTPSSVDSLSLTGSFCSSLGTSPSPAWLYVDSADAMTPTEALSTGIASPINDSPVGGAPSVQVYTLLVLALNQSYNYEYDFSKVSRDAFKHEKSLSQAMNAITAHLRKFPRQQDTDVVGSFWNEVEVITNPSECDVYLYVPEDDDEQMEALTANRLWAEHYIFYHRKQRRIVLFRIQAESPTAPEEMDADAITDDGEEYVSTDKNRDVHYSPRMHWEELESEQFMYI